MAELFEKGTQLEQGRKQSLKSCIEQSEFAQVLTDSQKLTVLGVFSHSLDQLSQLDSDFTI